MPVTATAALDLLFPRACVACDSSMSDGVICGVCWSQLALLPSPQCERCGHPALAPTCAYCAAFPPWVRAVRSVCWIPDTVGGAAVAALKYDGWTAIADAMAVRMARVHWPADVIAERTALVPVPLARTRRRERGYNQAELLVHALAPKLGLPVWDDAAKQLVRYERWTQSTLGIAHRTHVTEALPRHKRRKFSEVTDLAVLWREVEERFARPDV